jgi:hypothetical protein
MTPSARASSLGICRTARAGGVHYVEQVHRHFRAGGHLPNDPHRPGRERRGRLSCPERLHVEPFHKPGTGLRGHDLECGWPMKVWKKPPISSVIYRNQLAQRRGRPLCSRVRQIAHHGERLFTGRRGHFRSAAGMDPGPPRCPGDAFGQATRTIVAGAERFLKTTRLWIRRNQTAGRAFRQEPPLRMAFLKDSRLRSQKGQALLRLFMR